MGRIAFRFSIFYQKSHWHNLLAWLYREVSPFSSYQLILYFSTFRGESVNVTLLVKKDIREELFIRRKLEALNLFLDKHGSPSHLCPEEFNNEVFKHFENNQIYYGIHQEIINNFRFEDSMDYSLIKLKSKISQILIHNFQEESISMSDLIGTAIVIIVITRKYMNRPFKSSPLHKSYNMMSVNSNNESTKYQAMKQIVGPFLKIANEVFESKETDLYLDGYGTLLKEIQNHNLHIYNLYDEVLNTIGSQLGFESDFITDLDNTLDFQMYAR